jgi:hypothetical protein
MPAVPGQGPEAIGGGPDLIGAQLRALYQQAPNNDLLRLIELHDSATNVAAAQRAAALMRTLDAINSRYGRDTLRPGGTTARGTWSMRRANLSPCYTTRFDEMLSAKA